MVRLSRILKYRINGAKKVSYKESMLNATELCGDRSHFIMLYHTPKALLRSVYERLYSENEEGLLRNIRHRFRHATQYNAEELHYLTLYNEGRCIMRDANSELIYLMAKPDMVYLRRKLDIFSKASTKKFGCFNSLDQAPMEGQRMVVEWIENRIELKKV